MTKYREIIRLKSLNFSGRNIELNCIVSRNIVSKIYKKTEELKLSWPLGESMTDDTLEKLVLITTNHLQINVYMIMPVSVRNYFTAE